MLIRPFFCCLLLLFALGFSIPSESWAQSCEPCCKLCEAGMCLFPPPCDQYDDGPAAAPVPEPTAALLFLAGSGIIAYSYSVHRRRRANP